MRKVILWSVLIIGIFLLPQEIHAQYKKPKFFDPIKIEAGWGLNMPIGPAKGVSISDYTGWDSFYVGTNYALNKVWGLRGVYAYNNFRHKENENLQLTMHRFVAELTVSLSEAFILKRLHVEDSDFDIIAHSGLGVSIGTSSLHRGTDWVKNIQIGVMPIYRVLERIYVHLDLVYVLNTAQDYSFDGEAIKKSVGGYITANMGVTIRLGE